MSPMFKRILITGGAGFVGSNLVRELQRRFPEAELCVIDDFRTGTFANLSEEFGSGFLLRQLYYEPDSVGAAEKARILENLRKAIRFIESR